MAAQHEPRPKDNLVGTGVRVVIGTGGRVCRFVDERSVKVRLGAWAWCFTCLSKEVKKRTLLLF